MIPQPSCRPMHYHGLLMHSPSSILQSFALCCQFGSIVEDVAWHPRPPGRACNAIQKTSTIPHDSLHMCIHTTSSSRATSAVLLLALLLLPWRWRLCCICAFAILASILLCPSTCIQYGCHQYMEAVSECECMINEVCMHDNLCHVNVPSV